MGYFLSGYLKYFIFGIEGFGRKWNIVPTLGNHLSFLWDYCTFPYVYFVVVALIIDRFVGPLFFKKEVSELRTIQYG